MNGVQDVFAESRVLHVRELKAEVSRLKAENARLREEMSSLRAHLDMAILAAEDLKTGESLEIWDGWNLILGADRVAKDRDALLEQAKATGRRIWIVYDGHDERTLPENGLVRVSYTGGEGAHRADRFICDFVRMASYLGLSDHVSVRTNDRKFMKEINHLKGRFK